MVPVDISDNAKQVIEARYLNNETWHDMCFKRVGRTLAQRERNPSEWEEKMGGILHERLFMYSGRILRNAGKVHGNMLSCFNIPLRDNIRAIGEFIKNALIVWKHGGGIGTFADLRPKGAELQTYGGYSSGLVSFFRAFDAVGDVVETGGQRRAAGLGITSVSHPELFEFLDSKLQNSEASILSPKTKEAVKRLEKLIFENGDTNAIEDWITIVAELTKKLTHFNLSVAINNEFLEAVERDNGWDFTYNMQKYGEMPAREIWHEIVKRMVEWAEPGIINWTNFVKNNSFFFAPVTAANASFSGDTLISTTEGLIPIKELVEKKIKCITDLRCSYSSYGTLIEEGYGFKTGRKELFEVKLRNGQTIKLTADHKVWTQDGWKEVQNLEIKKDYMYVQNSISQNFIGNLSNQEEFDDGFLVGYLVGDGHITYHKVNKCVQYGFAAHEDENGLMDFIKMKMNFLSINHNRECSWSPHHDCKAKQLTSSDQGVKNFFKKWGYDSKTNQWGYVSCDKKSSKFISNEVLTETPSFKRGFISGLFAADACDYDGITLVTVKKHIAHRTQIMLNEFGILSKKGNRTCTNPWNGKKYIAYSISIRKNSEVRKFMNLIGFGYSKKGKNLPLRKAKEIRIRDGQFLVKSIKSIGIEDVYDVHTKTTETLIANGIVAHNCSEICLEDWGSCLLGSIALPRFLAQKNTKWKEMEETLRIAARALDNVIDINHYIVPQIEEATKNARRLGIGYMGLSDYFFQKGIRYGSQESLNEIERIGKFIRNVVYDESVKLAREKGVFPKFDAVSFGKASFVRKLPQGLRSDIKRYGIRNTTMLAGAPTGTISLVADVNSGIETLFSKAYRRKDNVSERYYIHPVYASYLKGEIDALPDWFVDAHDVSPSEHLDVLTTALKYTDSNISKTINLPKGTTVEEVENLLLEYAWDVKGVTIYVDGSRDEQVLYPLSEEEARQHLKDSDENQDAICVGGACEL